MGLFESTYSKPGDNGRRGVMIIVHPFLEKETRLAGDLGGLNPNILWIRIDMEEGTYFVASVYLPDNRKHKEADEVINQLFEDMESIAAEALIIIMGDWNFDPFIDKGSNKAAFTKMMSHPRMALVRRTSPTEWTRPASKTHIDNLFISKTMIPKSTSQIFYLHIPSHTRTPSDHLLVGFSSTFSGKRRRMRSTTLQYDNAPLRACADHAYIQTLDRLAGRWLTWASDLRQEMDDTPEMNKQEAEILFAGLKLIVYSASFQTLPTKRKKERAINEGAMQIKFASGRSRQELWEVVSRRLKSKTRPRTTSPDSLVELETKLREQGAKTPSSSCRSTRKWVRRTMAELDADFPTMEAKVASSFHHLVETYYQILIAEVKHLRWKTAGGLDNISATQIKRAPLSFLRALALFAARCAWFKCFPRWFRLARAKFIPKPEEGKFRGLRLESLLTKLVEKCILHPFFPTFGPDSNIIAPEHFADKKRLSAEMTAGILAIILDSAMKTRRPLYILIADAKEAYDMVWREALWAKLAKAHPRVEEVKRARAMYEHMDAQIVEEGFASSIVSQAQGIPQGGPGSGKLFAFSNSDLPEQLKREGVGTEIGRTEMTCAIYLDDSMIPSHSEEVMRRALLSLENYGDRWSQLWSVTKFKMLCLNVLNPPEQWPFKGTWFHTVQVVK